MSDYHHTPNGRNFSHTPIDSGRSGTGLFWLLFVVAALGALVLVGSLGGGSTTVEHPGGAGAEPVIAPAEPESSATGTQTLAE